MFHLLHLLFLIFFLSVVEAERVPTTFALAKAEVAWDVVRVLQTIEAENFERCHKRKDLDPGGRGNLIDCVKGVHCGIRIDPRLFVAREVIDLWENPSKAGKLSNTAVDELRLAEDLQASVTFLAEPPRAGRILRKAKRVKAAKNMVTTGEARLTAPLVTDVAAV